MAENKTSANHNDSGWLELILPRAKAYNYISYRGMSRLQEDIYQHVARILEEKKQQGKVVEPKYAFGVLRKILLQFWEKGQKNERNLKRYAFQKQPSRTSQNIPSPIETLIMDEQIQILRNNIEKLTMNEYLIFIFRIEQDLPFKTIANVVGMKESTTRLKYAEIVDRLRSQIE